MMNRGMNAKNQKKNYSFMIKSFKPFIIPLMISFTATLISVILSILAPQYLKELTNEMALNQATHSIDLDLIWHFATTLIIFYVTNAFLSLLSGITMNTITQLYSKNMREKISKKMNKMPLNYFDTHPFGDTLSVVTNDIDTLGQSLQQSVSMIAQSVFMLVGVLIAMFITSYQMALTVLITIPLIIVMLMVIMKLAQPQFIKRQKLLGEVTGIVEENYTGQLVINVFNAEDIKGRKFSEKNEELHKTMIKAQFFGGIMQPMMSFISYFAYAAVLLVGGLLLANGNPNISYGTITAFLVYANLFQSPLSQIAQALNSVQLGAAAAFRVSEFLDEKEEESEDNKETLLDLKDIKGKVEFKNVNFGYLEDKTIIHNFNTKVKPGMKVAIVGPTGAGKTTIVNLLMRFYEVNSGDILIDDVKIKDMKREDLRKIFGMVLQDTWIFNGTIKENIIYNLEDVKDERLNEILDEANLTHFVNTLPNGVDTQIKDDSSLSQGQRQLITIARAMAEDAPLLILDEATSNVDTRTEILVSEAMDRLTKGRTSFVIAHRLSTIKNADLILVIKDGNIIEQGTHDELLLQGGFYNSLYNSQFDVE